MIAAVPKESYPGEKRVSLIPAHIQSLIKSGLSIIVESDAGLNAGFPDQLYEDKGATIVKSKKEFNMRKALELTCMMK